MKKLIYKVVENLNKPEHDFAKSSYKIVTETIKTLFAKEGEKLSLFSCAHRNLNIYQEYEFADGEWLFDFILYSKNKDNGLYLEDIPLVVESEISDKKDIGRLKTDFDKLLMATASVKVFITTSHNLDEKSDFIQKSINAFKNFNYTETLYHIVWDESEGNFKVNEFCKKY